MNILIATDGSEFSMDAARKSCELLAIDERSKITILSVVDIMTAQTPFGSLDEYYVLLRKAAREAATDIVKDTEQELRKILEEGVSIETIIVKGKAAEMILGKAEKINADVIVVGSHGRGFLGRMILGSVSNAITKHAVCSVLVIR